MGGREEEIFLYEIGISGGGIQPYPGGPTRIVYVGPGPGAFIPSSPPDYPSSFSFSLQPQLLEYTAVPSFKSVPKITIAAEAQSLMYVDSYAQGNLPKAHTYIFRNIHAKS